VELISIPFFLILCSISGPIVRQGIIESAGDFLSLEFGVPVNIVEAEGSGHLKALTALPFKPAIVIELIVILIFFLKSNSVLIPLAFRRRESFEQPGKISVYL